MPHPCQNRRETAVTSGQPQTLRTASDLGMSRLTPCAKRPSKQRVTLRKPCVTELSYVEIKVALLRCAVARRAPGLASEGRPRTPGRTREVHRSRWQIGHPDGPSLSVFLALDYPVRTDYARRPRYA